MNQTTPQAATPPSDPQRTRDLAQIHAAAKRQGLDRESYEALLYHHTGATSAKDLDAAQRGAVLAALGLDPGAVRAWRPGAKPEQVSDKQWKYIGDLCVRLHLDESSFARLVRHITGLDNPTWLSVPTARRLLAGMIDAYGGKGKRTPTRGNPRRAGPDPRR